MSLDNIKLPPLVLQQLYTHSLIETKNTPQIDANIGAKVFLTLGNNQKKVQQKKRSLNLKFKTTPDDTEKKRKYIFE